MQSKLGLSTVRSFCLLPARAIQWYSQQSILCTHSHARLQSSAFRCSPEFLPYSSDFPSMSLGLQGLAQNWGSVQSELGLSTVRSFYLLPARERQPGTQPPPPLQLRPLPMCALCLHTLGFYSSSDFSSGFLFPSSCRISSQSTFL